MTAAPVRRAAWLAPLALLVACSSATAPDITTTTFAASLGVDLAAMTRTNSGLYYRDVTVGTGALVAAGQQVAVHYIGNLPNGNTFDVNDINDTPFAFVLGAGQVIPGFDEGVAGMHVGGRRQIIIPPNLGYGSQAAQGIPGNSILVFTVDVVSAQ